MLNLHLKHANLYLEEGSGDSRSFEEFEPRLSGPLCLDCDKLNIKKGESPV